MTKSTVATRPASRLLCRPATMWCLATYALHARMPYGGGSDIHRACGARGWYDFNRSIAAAAPFERPETTNSNDDISLLYFTSGTTASPRWWPTISHLSLGHIITASYWHNLDEDSLHLTPRPTQAGAKAVWGKLYGQWDSRGQCFCLRLREV